MPKFNWSPEQVTFIDLETQSAVNLKDGQAAYLKHPTTRLMSLVAKRGNTILTWVPAGRYPGRKIGIAPSELCSLSGTCRMLDDGPTMPPVLQRWLSSSVAVAHNAAGFDAEAWERVVLREFAGPSPEWFDTIFPARAAGLPGSLDALGRIFTGEGKDAQGSKALKMLYTAKVRSGEIIYPVGTLPLWKMMLKYNVQDVLLLEQVYHRVRSYVEGDVLAAHIAINQRGIAFDRPFLNRLIDLWTEAEQDALKQIAELSGLAVEDLRSPVRMKRWLEKAGLHLESINRKQLERFYEHPEEFLDGEDISERHAFICQILQLRQTVTRIGKAKLQKILDMSDQDGRVRNVIVYHGAHTGRFSGRGFQPHNMTRGVSALDVQPLCRADLTYPELRAAALAARCSADDALSTILRPVFIGSPLAIADYAAIEARGVAWVAGEESLLSAFRENQDIYCQMASLIFGRAVTKANDNERQIGKITVLGCGYSMSANKFAAFCKAQRIDLNAAGTSAEACVEAYRAAYPAICDRRKGIWSKYQRACFDAVNGKEAKVGKCHFYQEGMNLIIRLPSGRRLTYREASIQDRVPGYAAMLGLQLDPRPTLVYQHVHGYEGTLYGGLLTENIVQAIGRDLLCDALIRCENRGLRPVMHVHDEIICESSDIESLLTIMSEPPTWAAGFPVKAEGFTCPRYSKKPFKVVT